MTKYLFIFFLLGICGFFVHCKKEVLNTIPPQCYSDQFANFSVNDTLQEIKEEWIEGVNIHSSYGIKTTGEWAVALESNQYAISILVGNLLSDQEYQELSYPEWKKFIENKGTYSLNNNPLVQQILIHDFNRGNVFTQIDSLNGKVSISYEVPNKNCNYLVVSYQFNLQKNNSLITLSGNIKVPIPKKI